MRPLGVMGGTFDPVHFGHLRLAEEACDALGLGDVLWSPAGRPPHRHTPAADAAARAEMVRLAVAGNPRFRVDAGEARSGEPSYTVALLQRLRAACGTQPLVLLLGSDAFLGLATWHRWRELAGLAHLAVATRPGYDLAEAVLPRELAEHLPAPVGDPAVLATAPAGRVVQFAMTPLGISASLLRARIAAGVSVRYLLPDPVREYIHRQHLYRISDGP